MFDKSKEKPNETLELLFLYHWRRMGVGVSNETLATT
jgi:hypothetical protein